MAKEARTSSNGSLSWKRLWPAVSGIMIAAILIIDFFTRSFGFIEIVIGLVRSSPPVLVHVSPINVESGGTCLKFGFEKMPKNFNLGKIQLKIVDAGGPTAIAGDMSARVLEVCANMELSSAIFSGGKKKLEFHSPFYAEKENDVAIVDFCPTLTMPGMSGWLTVVPSFFSVAGELIEDIKITANEGTSVEEGIKIILSRPKNANVSVDETSCRC